MVIIFVVILSFTRFKEEITSYHFEDGAGKAPNISWSVVVSTNDDLWRSVLSSLNFRSEMMVCPTAITHITDFNLHIFINLPTSLVDLFLLLLQQFLLVISIVFSQETSEFRHYIHTINTGLLSVFLFLVLLSVRILSVHVFLIILLFLLIIFQYLTIVVFIFIVILFVLFLLFSLKLLL